MAQLAADFAAGVADIRTVLRLRRDLAEEEEAVVRLGHLDAIDEAESLAVGRRSTAPLAGMTGMRRRHRPPPSGGVPVNEWGDSVAAGAGAEEDEARPKSRRCRGDAVRLRARLLLLACSACCRLPARGGDFAAARDLRGVMASTLVSDELSSRESPALRSLRAARRNDLRVLLDGAGDRDDAPARRLAGDECRSTLSRDAAMSSRCICRRRARRL